MLRFSELTKTEMIVVCFLYAKRNRKTGQCNPTRSTIAREVGIDRSHVSKAIAELDHKGWVFEMADGNFSLCEEPDFVAKSARAKSAHPVRNPPQSEAKSATEPCEIRLDAYKDSSEQRKEQINEQRENALALVADEMAINEVEKAFDIRLDLQTRKLVVQAVPPNLIDRFPAFISGRAVGWANKSPTEKLAKIGYALTDFQKENKNGTNQPTFREQRQSNAIAERNVIDAARERIAQRKLSGFDAGDSGGKLRSLVAKPDDG